MSKLVKICGVTNLEDALCAAGAGAHAIGLNFAEGPRQVTLDQAREITGRLPETLGAVALFVNPSLQFVVDTVVASGVNAIQLHGDESPEFVQQAADYLYGLLSCKGGWPAIAKAFSPRTPDDLTRLAEYTAADAFLIDAYVEGLRGGTGQTGDWSLAASAKDYGKIILAGGLNPANIRDAISQTNPFAVDVSSGVEALPGKKDPEKVRQFIQQVKQA